MARGKGGKAVVDRTKRGRPRSEVGGGGRILGDTASGSTGCSVQGWRAGLKCWAGVDRLEFLAGAVRGLFLFLGVVSYNSFFQQLLAGTRASKGYCVLDFV